MFSFLVIIVMFSTRDKKLIVVVVEIVAETATVIAIKTKKFDIRFNKIKSQSSIKLKLKTFRRRFSTKNFVQIQQNVLNAKNQIIEDANNVEESEKTKKRNKTIEIKK